MREIIGESRAGNRMDWGVLSLEWSIGKGCGWEGRVEGMLLIANNNQL